MAATDEQVLSFVRSSIRSAWTLEVLLLLRRDPRRSWNIDDLVRELRGSVALVRESLNALSALGLLAASATEGYHYRAEAAALDELVSALAELYQRKPTTVLHTIFTSPNDKIQSFSDAFLIKKN
jgi:hypothetical protein